MALGIKEYDEIYRELSIPLKVQDLEWVIEHLRHLADELEKGNKDIMEIRLSHSQAGMPYFQVVTFK